MKIKPIQAIKCFLGFHDVYSKAEDLDFDFGSLNIEELTHEETVLLFFEMSATRCRHCDYIYSSYDG